VTEPIPIVQVIVSTREGGGPQHVLTVAQGLRARGWRSIMVGPADGPLFARFGEAGLDAVALRTDRLQPLTLMRLVRLIRRTGARLVHSHRPPVRHISGSSAAYRPPPVSSSTSRAHRSAKGWRWGSSRPARAG
jgi:hypothetical protein